MKHLIVLMTALTLFGCATTSPSSSSDVERVAIAYTVSVRQVRGRLSKGIPTEHKFRLGLDFECPYCARANGTLQELEKLYGESVQIVFMHNPLNFHKLALCRDSCSSR